MGLNILNSWLIGGLIIACMWLRLALPAGMPWLSWFTACLGAYVFLSPWLYAYIDHTGRWVNCMLLGLAVALSNIVGGAAAKERLNQSATARRI